jgi:methyl-accepting chemotaxis protein
LDDVATGSTNIQKITKEYKGDFNSIKNSANTVYNLLFTFLGEINGLSEGARAGNLALRADTSKVEGAWSMMLDGVNNIVSEAEAIINDTEHTLKIMATGDLTPRITTEYKGKFAEVKNDINVLGDSLTDLISQLQEVIH